MCINKANLSSIDNFSSYIFRAAQNQALNSFKRTMAENCILKIKPVDHLVADSIEANLEYKLLQKNNRRLSWQKKLDKKAPPYNQ